MRPYAEVRLLRLGAVKARGEASVGAVVADVIYRAVKATARRVVAEENVERIKKFRWSKSVKEAQDALIFSKDGRDWLTDDEINTLRKIYPTTYTFSESENDGAPDFVRAKSALNALGVHGGSKNLVEIGGGPGYVAAAVALAGHRVTCVDIRDELKSSVRDVGVKCLTADACSLPLPDASVDGLWSYNCFEHIFDPYAALKEFSRIVRPNGRIYLDFAPIYNSALGLHAFLEMGIPFLQHLLPDDRIIPQVSSKDLWFLNRWSLDQYRKLWIDFAKILDVVRYHEGSDFQGLELIKKYPGCFQKVSRDINEFVTSKITVIFSVKYSC
ncbi:hypothetical protein C0214_05780 [Methylobacterium sp. DM1]|nr:hypothetical protein C0214_05780 [Methylobacterium sp. DM1]